MFAHIFSVQLIPYRFFHYSLLCSLDAVEVVAQVLPVVEKASSSPDTGCGGGGEAAQPGNTRSIEHNRSERVKFDPHPPDEGSEEYFTGCKFCI